MMDKILCIQILFIQSLFTFEVPSNCWIGNDEVRIDLLCPDYVGDGRTSCCGDPVSRFCCTIEEYEEEAKNQGKEVPLEIMEEKVILVKSDIEAKTIEYGEIKIQSDDMSFSLDGFKMKVKMFEELS